MAVEGEAVEAVVGAKDAVVLALAVANVADQGAADVLEVAADLMEAAGVELGLDEGVAAEGLAAPDLGARRDALLARGARDGVIDHEVIGRMAARDGEVALVGVGPGRRESAGGAGVEREEDQARGAAIEPVDGVDVAADGVAHALEEGVVAVVPAAMRRDPRRLVDDHAPRIAVDDHGCARLRGGRGAGGRSRSGLARARG